MRSACPATRASQQTAVGTASQRSNRRRIAQLRATRVLHGAALRGRAAATCRCVACLVLSRREHRGLRSPPPADAPRCPHRAALGTFAVPIVAGMVMSSRLSSVRSLCGSRPVGANQPAAPLACARSRSCVQSLVRFRRHAYALRCCTPQVSTPVAAAPVKRPRPRMPAKKDAPADPPSPDSPPDAE